MSRSTHLLLVAGIAVPALGFTAAFVARLLSPAGASATLAVLTDEPRLITNTILYGGLTALVATASGWLLAHLQYTYALAGRRLLHLLTLVPLLLPSLTFAMGLVMLFGHSGVVTRIVGGSGSSYGLGGLVIAGAWARAPLAYLLLSAGYRTIDGRAVETAADLGAGQWRILRWVILPRIAAPLVVSVATLTAETVTDLAVPLVVGGNFGTLAGRVLETAIGESDMVGAAAHALWLLPIALLLHPLAGRFASRPQLDALSTPSANRPLDRVGRVLQGIGWLVVGFTVVLVLTVVIGAFAGPTGVTLTHFVDVLAGSQTRALATTVLLALISVPAIMLIGFGLARTAVLGRPLRTHRLFEVVAAVPGMVLGLGALTAISWGNELLSGAGVPSVGTAWMAGFAIVLVYLVRFVPLVSQPLLITATAAAGQVRDTALNLGASPRAVTRFLLVPKLAPDLVNGTVTALTRVLMSISSVIWLVNAQVPLLSVRMLIDVDAGRLSAAAAMNVILATLVGLAWLTARSLTAAGPRQAP